MGRQYARCVCSSFCGGGGGGGGGGADAIVINMDARSAICVRLILGRIVMKQTDELLISAAEFDASVCMYCVNCNKNELTSVGLRV